jgi:hypothetical protein
MSEITEIFRGRSNVHHDPDRHSCHAAYTFSNRLALSHHVQTIVGRRNVFGGRFNVVLYFSLARLRFKSSRILGVCFMEVDSIETPHHLNCKRIILSPPKSTYGATAVSQRNCTPTCLSPILLRPATIFRNGPLFPSLIFRSEPSLSTRPRCTPS